MKLVHILLNAVTKLAELSTERVTAWAILLDDTMIESFDYTMEIGMTNY